jgi:cupin fold WbuC family metalloprotein
MKLIRQSQEVYSASDPVVLIGGNEIEELKTAVATAPRGRVRINAHPGVDDPLHEMFIAIRANCYIRPHKHPGKSVALHVIYGTVDVILFNDDGTIDKVARLSARDALGEHFYCRVLANDFYAFVIRSDLLVMHEIVNGPFRREEVVYAPFAPEEGDVAAASAYMAELEKRVAGFAPAVP